MTVKTRWETIPIAPTSEPSLKSVRVVSCQLSRQRFLPCFEFIDVPFYKTPSSYWKNGHVFKEGEQESKYNDITK